MGGFVLTLRIEAAGAGRTALIEGLTRELLPATLGLPRIAGAHLCVNDASLSGGQVGARQGRFITQPDVVVLVEGSTADGVRAIGDSLLTDSHLVNLGAKASIQRDLYQLEYSLQNIVNSANEPPSTATGLHDRSAALPAT